MAWVIQKNSIYLIKIDSKWLRGGAPHFYSESIDSQISYVESLNIGIMSNTTIKGKAPYLSPLIGFKNENSRGYANLKFTNGKVTQPPR